MLSTSIRLYALATHKHHDGLLRWNHTMFNVRVSWHELLYKTTRFPTLNSRAGLHNPPSFCRPLSEQPPISIPPPVLMLSAKG